MIEYYYHLKTDKSLSVCILITDGTTRDEIREAVISKYDFSQEEIECMFDNLYTQFQPKVILTNTLIVVNGSLRFKGASLLTKRTILFRCSDDDIVRDDVLVLQDNDVYDPIPNSEHYKKKILLSKFKHFDNTSGNTAMFYLTSVCRMSDVSKIVDKYNYKYIALANKLIEGIKTFIVPAHNLWNLFDVFIYTKTSGNSDCSPRFIVECEYYNKKVIYEHNDDYIGLNVRINDMNKGLDFVSLKETDELVNWIRY
jgi:hypothetical protein